MIDLSPQNVAKASVMEGTSGAALRDWQGLFARASSQDQASVARYMQGMDAAPRGGGSQLDSSLNGIASSQQMAQLGNVASSLFAGMV